MSYMRGDPYIYSDGINLNIYYKGSSVYLPMDAFDELVAMHWHRMTADKQRAATERAYLYHADNFGADGVARQLGKPTVAEQVAEQVKEELEP